MGVRSIVALAVAGCGFSPATSNGVVDGHTGDGEIDAAPGAWLTGYHFRKAIHVTPNIATTLADYPLAIVRVSDAQLAAHAAGDDLVVTSSDAVTPLDRELVGFAPNGALELWVHLPALGPGPTTLYLYYGGPLISNAQIWSAYAGVWHLSDPMPIAKDSTTRANDLVSPSMGQRPMPVAGIAGGARSFDGVDDVLGITPGDSSLDVGLGSFSFSIWAKVAMSPLGYQTPLWKGGTSSAEHGYCFLTNSGAWLAKVHDGFGYRDPMLTTGIANNTWVHLAGVLDRSAGTFTAYFNGAYADSQSLAGLGTLDTALPFDVGRAMTTSFKGTVDESRLIKSVLAPDWIKAEHANLSDSGFVVLDTEAMR